MNEPVARFPTDRFRSLIELTADWYWEQDADLRFCLYEGGSRNHRWRSVQNASLGMRRWELPGVQLHLSDWDAHRADLEARRAFLDFEFARRLPNGQLFWVSVSGHPLFDRRGEFTGYRGLARDITVRKQTERAFADSQMFLDKAGQIAGVGAWQIDIETGRVSWSRQTRLLHEVDDTFVPTLGNGFDFYPPSVRQQVKDAVELSISRAEPWQIEVPFVTAKGRERWVRVSGEAELEQGRVIRLLGGFQDVTEIRAALVAAEAASRSKSAFLANMSHEIRTPLNAVLGMLQLLENTGLDERQADYARKAQTAARSLLGLLNDVLDLSRVEAGKLLIDVHPFETRKLFRNLSAILAASLGERPVELLFDIDPAVPALLEGDLLRLQQVLVNLGGNAVKFTPQGQVLLRVQVEHSADAAVRLGFSVQDTGVGIAPDQQQMIFEGFTQAEASINRRFGGSGLGLAISQRLVSLMGGQLQVQSELGQGSRFFFSLDFKLPKTQAQNTPDPLNREHADGDQQPAARRVLVLEPHEGLRDVLTRMLGSMGWSALIAANLHEAFDRLGEAKNPVDVVFLDAALASILPADELERLWRAPLVHRAGVVVLQQASQDPAWTALKRSGRFIASWLKPVTICMLEELAQVLDSRDHNSPKTPAPGAAPLKALLGVKVLLVEDNAVNQQLAVELLEQQGARVEVVAHGQAALDRLAQGEEASFDCVLMDIQMPVMDGYTATRQIRQNPRFARLPILAMTANALPSDREAAFAAGMNDHIAKPFELSDLVSRIQGQLSGAPRVVWTSPSSGPIESPRATQSAPTPSAEGEVEQALARVGGDRGLLVRMWIRFHDELGDIMQLAELANTQTPKLDEWARHAHTLKGLAATLGLSKLASLATDADQALKAALIPNSLSGQNTAASEWQVWIERLHQACALGQAEVKRLLAQWDPSQSEAPTSAGLAPTSAVGAPALDAAPSVLRSEQGQTAVNPQYLEQLLTLLADHNLDALLLIEHPELAALRSDPYWTDVIEPTIHALDFDRAHPLLDRYLKTRDIQ